MSLGGRVAKAGAGAPENKGEKETPQMRGVEEAKRTKRKGSLKRGRTSPGVEKILGEKGKDGKENSFLPNSPPSKEKHQRLSFDPGELCKDSNSILRPSCSVKFIKVYFYPL